MLVYLFVLGLITNLSTACLDCPPEDGERGKLTLGPFPADEDNLRAIAMASRGLLGSGLQQKARLYQKVMGQQQQQQNQRPPSILVSPSSSSLSALGPESNLLHVYTLLNKGSGTEPRVVVGDYFLQDPVLSRLSKRAEKGMMVDVMDYVSKSDDRNRRVGQNMRSSG